LHARLVPSRRPQPTSKQSEAKWQAIARKVGASSCSSQSLTINRVCNDMFHRVETKVPKWHERRNETPASNQPTERVAAGVRYRRERRGVKFLLNDLPSAGICRSGRASVDDRQENARRLAG